jgi:hypothetical protein
MENTFPATAPENPAEMEAAIKRMFAEMELADERIRRTQKEINTLKAEIRAKREPVKAG